MSRALDDDLAAGARSTLRHLNLQHPDTVVFLARHAAGAPDAVAAELRAVDPHGIDITVRQPSGASTQRLRFSAAISGIADLRGQLQGLLRAARTSAPDEPLTSLEAEITSRGTRQHDRPLPPPGAPSSGSAAQTIAGDREQR